MSYLLPVWKLVPFRTYQLSFHFTTSMQPYKKSPPFLSLNQIPQILSRQFQNISYPTQSSNDRLFLITTSSSLKKEGNLKEGVLSMTTV